MVAIVDKMMNIYRKEYERNPVFTLFLTILILFFVIFVAAAIITDGDTLYSVLNANRSYFFSDYFESVVNSTDHPYTKINVLYPPFIVTFYMVLGRFIMPYVDLKPGTTIDQAIELTRISQIGIISYLVITLLTFYALYLIFSKLIKEEGVRKEFMFLFLILLAYPFVYAVERGNSILLALVFCFVFLLGYRSENKIIRCASYIALGCATGIKLYPVILWLLILRDRNYREAGISALIVAALAFVPFIFTDGTPLMLFDNIFSYTSTSLGFTNIDQIITGIFQEGLGVAHGTVSIMCYAAIGIFTLLSFVVILYDKEMKFWKVVTLIGCNLVLGLGLGVQYQIVYMVLGILYFLAAEREMTKENRFYVICFAMMMVLIPGIYIAGFTVFGADAYPSAVIGAIESAFVIVVAIALLREGLGRIYRNRRGGLTVQRGG
jgi:hypothetical protein